jgi:hypothetical protein
MAGRLFCPTGSVRLPPLRLGQVIEPATALISPFQGPGNFHMHLR